MKILKVEPYSDCRVIPEVALLLRNQGHEVKVMHPAFWSALTASTIASNLKTFAADRVEVERLKDAVAALSARKLAPEKSFEVAIRVPRNSEPWRHAGRLATENVSWIFPSERLKAAFGFEGTIEAIDFPLYEANADGLKYAIFGSDAPITYIRLKDAVEAIAASQSSVLHVYGEFKARHIMPVVRRCKALEIENRVVWHGIDYDFEKAIQDCDFVLLSQYEPTDDELVIESIGCKFISKI